MALRRSDQHGDHAAGLSRAEALDLCARLASYSEADAAPRDLLTRAGMEAVQRFPDDSDVLVAVGRMFLAGEELADAERVLRRAVRFAPQDPHGLRLLGEVLLRRGDPAAAHAALSSAVACGMNDPWTKIWVARALDYSELLDDLGRDGIALDVRQVLGKPGQGPAEDERRFTRVQRSEPPARRYSRKGVLGRMDKGVFFAGDARAEPPDFRLSRPSPDEIVDLPTPAPPGTSHDERDGETAAPAARAGSAPDIEISTTRMERTGAPEVGIAGARWQRTGGPDVEIATTRVQRKSADEMVIEAALADDSAWGSPASKPRSGPGSAPVSTPRSGPGSDPRSEPMPPSDTEISAWVPDMEAIARDRRSAPPVQLRSSAPPPRGEDVSDRVAPPPPALPRLTAAELYDEFTEHKRSLQSLRTAASTSPADNTKRRGPPPLPPEPPPLPPEPVRPVNPAVLATGRSAALPDDWVPRRAVGTPSITVIGDDAPVTAPPSALIPLETQASGDLVNGPVTAPPSALIPLEEPASGDDAPGPLTAPASALIPLEMPASREIAASARASREMGPMTAPPSALLPPEPPSLQIPSKSPFGTGLKPPAPAATAAPAEKTPAEKTPAPAAKQGRSRVQSVVLRALLALVVAAVLLGGLELYKRNRTTKLRAFAAQAAIALHSGGPRGVADAEAALASARQIDPKSRTVALAVVRARFFAVLDVDAARLPDLIAATKDAEALGVRGADLAFAEVVSHFAGGDVATAGELVAHHDEDPERATDPLFQLAAGVAVEAQDPTAAAERYRAALKLDADLLSAEIRLTRALAFSERLAEANDRLAGLLQKFPARSDLTALAAVVAAADPARAASAKIDPSTDVDMLPRPLRAAARVLSKGGDEQAVAKAASEADIAPIIVLCGETALRSGHEAAARDAAQHAIEVSPGYAPAYALIARVALAAGRFEESRQAALRAPPDVAAEVLAWIAYEAGDAAAMTSAAGRRAEGATTEPIPAGLARLRGAAPLAASILQSLAKSGRYWADVVAMDGALDAGDLDLAQTIANGWPGGDKHPIRAARVARLARYQGKNGAAQTASSSAAPTLSARVEGALAAAEMASARDAAASSLAGARTPEERWTLAFLLARDGRAAPAHAAVNGLAQPPADAPLLTRRVAALALAELHATNPATPLFTSLVIWQRNPDVARAFGPVRPAAAPDGAPPPDKPVLKGKIPSGDGGDPY